MVLLSASVNASKWRKPLLLESRRNQSGIVGCDVNDLGGANPCCGHFWPCCSSSTATSQGEHQPTRGIQRFAGTPNQEV